MDERAVEDTDVHATENELLKLQNLVGQVKSNYSLLHQEVLELQKQQEIQNGRLTDPDPDQMQVSRVDLLKLQKEVRMLKGMLGNTINQDLLPAYTTLHTTLNDLASARQTSELAETEKDHWRSQWEGSLETAERDKEEKVALRCELQDTTLQLAQQSEFCATMGAACCTLMWRVTRSEDSIQAILVGTKVEEFLGLVSSTLDSYLQTYREEIPSDSSDESQFVLALCGIITNIAASAFGRDYLMKQEAGRQLVDIYVRVLEQEPCYKLAKMKNLILMGLYNLTINQKGLKLIGSKPGLLGLLAWQIQGSNDVDNRLNALRLTQSLVYEQSSRRLIHEAREALPPEILDGLCREPCLEIREAAQELASDLVAASNEQ